MTVFRPIIVFLFIFSFYFQVTASEITHAPSDCIDSVHVKVTPVKCNGLRRGIIRVDSVYGGIPPYQFSLNNADWSAFPEFDRLWAGVYTLYIRDALGCLKIQSVEVPEPEPLQVYIVANDTTVNTGVLVTLRAQYWPELTKVEHAAWWPPQIFEVQDTLYQSVRLQETTTILVEIRNEKGCTAQDSITIYVEKINYYFPNVIKPGSNQDAYFTVYSEEGMRNVAQMQIFSRNGAMVFENKNFPPNDPKSGWDGKWRGRFATPGVYSWVAVLEFEDGHRENHAGTITVVR